MKDFMLIGPAGGVMYKEIYPLITEGKIWIPQEPGFTHPLTGKPLKTNNSMAFFEVSDEYYQEQLNNKIPNVLIDYQGKKTKNEKAYWYFSIPRKSYHLELTSTYTPEEYPPLDNYEAIEVKRFRKIPRDYQGVMAVPFTYLSVHNPEDFEIIRKVSNARLNGKNLFTRLIIRRKQL